LELRGLGIESLELVKPDLSVVVDIEGLEKLENDKDRQIVTCANS